MRRAPLAALAALALVVTATVGGGAVAAPPEGDRRPALADPTALGQVETPTNGTPVPHVDPDRDEAVDYGRIGGWLSVALAGRLGASADELDRGDYARARTLLGDDADRYLALYDDVAGETSSETDDRLARQFADTVATQRTFATEVEEFQETAEAYRDARQAGESDRARRLARELVRQAAQVDETGDALSRNYTAIGNETGRDVSAETAVVSEISANVSATSAGAADESLRRTAVTVETAGERASFDEPLAVTGRVAAANGSPIADGPVRLLIDGRSLATGRTAEDGSFALSGRPTLVESGRRTVTVRYDPPAESVYLGSNATVEARIDAVEPTVAVEAGPDPVRFGDAVTARGRVAVGDTPVPGVPVVVTFGGERRLRLETDADGAFAGDFRLPADVDPGGRPLTAALQTEGLAVGPAAARIPLEVGVRGTRLELRAERVGDGGARVEGSLATDDGRPVANQSVAIAVGGARVATVRTDGAGRFGTTVQPSGEPGEPVTVSADFAGIGTNLAPSAASATLPPAATDGPAPTVPGWWAVPVALGLLVGGGYLLHRRRRGGDGVGTEPPESGEADDGGRSAPAASLLERARAHHREGQSVLAVRFAYGAARDRLGGADGRQATRTHWEFYRALAAGLDEADAAAFRSLTESFERAAFARAGADSATADRAIEAADRLVGTD